MTSPVLQTVYASAPTDKIIIQTLEIVSDTLTLRFCNGFFDVTADLEDGTTVDFTAGNLAIKLPEKSDKVNQNLKFALWNVNSDGADIVNSMLENTEMVSVTYREYLSDDLSGPASKPLPFTLVGGYFEGIQMQLECAYMDALNTRWPREVYTNENAPGISYL